MTKICIIEDNLTDTVNRYINLDKSKHEVYLVIDEEILNFWEGSDRAEMRKRAYTKRLVEEGNFDSSKIQYGFQNIPVADIYFCDGLKGKFFKLADQLGKNKVYLNSSDWGINEEAKEKGYRTACQHDLEKIAGVEER